MVDEEMLLNIIDQMRISIPKEIEEAAELQAQRDRLLARAHDQARRILLQARDEAERMLDEDAVRTQARAEAEAMVREAHEHATRVIAGADRYAEEQLRGLERAVADLARVIQRGLETLAERRAQRDVEEEAAAPEPEAVDEAAEGTVVADEAEALDPAPGDDRQP